MKQVTMVEQIKKNLETGGFFLNCKIPMGYRTVFPVLQIKNGCLCITFPYLKYQTTGEVDRTLVFPIRYAVSLELPTEKVVSFEDFEYSAAFENMDFEKPIGYFRHEAIKKCDRTEYDRLYHELLAEYDKVIRALLEGGEYGYSDEKRMSELLRLLVEPFLLPIYQIIDKNFYDKYFVKGMVDYGA